MFILFVGFLNEIWFGSSLQKLCVEELVSYNAESVNRRLPVLPTFLHHFDRISWRATQYSAAGNCEFRKHPSTEGHPLLKEVNEVFLTFSLLLIRF